jgi:hypothetical protein
LRSKSHVALFFRKLFFKNRQAGLVIFNGVLLYITDMPSTLSKKAGKVHTGIATKMHYLWLTAPLLKRVIEIYVKQNTI